ncbi:MAG: hypothetical protein AB8H80_15630 [Planctomycetota bacterium]
MSAPPTTDPSAAVCLHCSPARTVWYRYIADPGLLGGKDVPGPGDGRLKAIEKVYVRGAAADAERELAHGRAAAGPGVAVYLGSGLEAQTGRPTIALAYHAGQNLEQVVASRGAIPAREALRLLQPVAATLSRLHGLRTPAFPAGMCHGDVKPQNLLACSAGEFAGEGADADRPADRPADGPQTLLLDFEHARAVAGGGTDRQPSSETQAGGQPSAESFTGGTSAFSPPEAHRGEPSNPSFDVFGFGATLAYLLAGGTLLANGTVAPDGTIARLPQHASVEALVQDCCSEQPDERPTAAQLAPRLDALLIELTDEPLEQALHGILFDGVLPANCVELLEDSHDPRARRCRRLQRLLRRRPGLLHKPSGIASKVHELRTEIDQCNRVLSRFPRNPNALTRRRELAHAAAEQLHAAAEVLREDQRRELFDDALQRLRTLESIVANTIATPGGLAILTQLEPGQSPGPRQRAPIEYVQHLIEQAEQAQRELVERAADVSAAEASFDLTLATQRIDEMAHDYGGTSPTVADRRDRLHRLGFYMERIARAAESVERAEPLWDSESLQPLHQLVAAAAGHTSQAGTPRHENASGHGSRRGGVGLRSLQLTLQSVADEFPHLTTVPTTLATLSAALVALTDNAWEQLDDASHRLTLVPVPVRPLQIALSRLDTFRTLEVFVDRPDRARSELIDGIERLRLGLEQARSARDQLAENAEHLIARGHWTTGLFDMERVVKRLNPSDDTERQEAERLQERLNSARRLRQEIKAAERRNVELTANYRSLEEDADSTSEARLEVLLAQRDGLLYLRVHATDDRATLYRGDLRRVETAIAVERATDAQRRFAKLDDLTERLRLARETVEALGAADSSAQPEGGLHDANEQPSRRIADLQSTWRGIAARCQREVDEQRAEQLAAANRQRRVRLLVAVGIIGAIAAVLAIALPRLFAA